MTHDLIHGISVTPKLGRLCQRVFSMTEIPGKGGILHHTVARVKYRKNPDLEKKCISAVDSFLKNPSTEAERLAYKSLGNLLTQLSYRHINLLSYGLSPTLTYDIGYNQHYDLVSLNIRNTQAALKEEYPLKGARFTELDDNNIPKEFVIWRNVVCKYDASYNANKLSLANVTALATDITGNMLYDYALRNKIRCTARAQKLVKDENDDTIAYKLFASAQRIAAKASEFCDDAVMSVPGTAPYRVLDRFTIATLSNFIDNGEDFFSVRLMDTISEFENLKYLRMEHPKKRHMSKLPLDKG